MIKRIIVFLMLVYSVNNYSIVTFGGYVPFGPSTQKDIDGSKNTLSFDPMISFNTVVPVPYYNQLFLPELGFVVHGSGADDYSKRTIFLLTDLGYRFTDKFMLRYGIGTFITTVSGDGGQTTLNNGGGTSTFYRPSESSSSWNTTLNLGGEYAIDQNFSLRFQTYMFSILSSTSRKLSYSLSLTYYL